MADLKFKQCLMFHFFDRSEQGFCTATIKKLSQKSQQKSYICSTFQKLGIFGNLKDFSFQNWHSLLYWVSLDNFMTILAEKTRFLL